MLKIRKSIFDIYTDALKDKEWAIIPFSKKKMIQSLPITFIHLD